jgi:hypothetical protein
MGMKSSIKLWHGMNMSRLASRSSRLFLTVSIGFLAALPSYSQAGNADEQTLMDRYGDSIPNAEIMRIGMLSMLSPYLPAAHG